MAANSDLPLVYYMNMNVHGFISLQEMMILEVGSMCLSLITTARIILSQQARRTISRRKEKPFMKVSDVDPPADLKWLSDASCWSKPCLQAKKSWPQNTHEVVVTGLSTVLLQSY